MTKRKFNEKGFGVVGALLILVVILVIVGGGLFVYHQNHQNKPTATTNASASKSTNNQKTAANTNNPYEGWKTYCDSVYNYCFRYPATWTVVSSASAQTVGGEGGINLLSPTKSVQVTYGNDFVKDSSVVSFMPSMVSKLTTASQDLTLVGGYVPSSGDNGLAGNDVPSYRVADSSTLNTYPLTVGQAGQLPSNSAFTDQGTGDTSYKGSLTSRPAIAINSVQESQNWLNSADAKTSVQILESLYYNK